jgi:hypothetical protein
MEFTSEQKEITKRLSYGSNLFRSYFYKDDSFKGQFEDNHQALICFFENYAYQRQGAAPAYSEIAVKSLKNRFSRGARSVTIADAKEVWKDYQEIARNEYNNLGVNRTHNPMCSDNGLLTVMAKKNITNLASHIKSLIQNNQTKEAHELVDDIRGIGPKIASLYLRDIAYLGRIPENRIKDQYCLQPVDTWIEQTLSIIFGDRKPKVLRKKQEMIVNLCEIANVSPIAFSQGAWMLGSQVAGDFSTFQQLAKGRNAKAIIKEHIEERKRYVSDAEHWLMHWPES